MSSFVIEDNHESKKPETLIQILLMTKTMFCSIAHIWHDKQTEYKAKIKISFV